MNFWQSNHIRGWKSVQGKGRGGAAASPLCTGNGGGGQNDMNNRYREEMIMRFVETEPQKDIYGGASLAKMLYSPQKRQEADGQLYRVAKWFELPHPWGRDHQGEPDFVANKLIRTLHLAEQLLSGDTLEAIHAFFTGWDFESKYKSENHMLLFHSSRYLYALRYQEAFFRQYQRGAAEILSEDREFLHMFMSFRARRGWAEFDSLGYGAECFSALLNLVDFGEETVSHYARMSADVLLLDMIADCSADGLYGGAHGRVYENMVMDFQNAPMCAIYQYYFGDQIYAFQGIEMISSGYLPSDYVYAALEGRPDSWENYESKHLHSITCETPHRQVPQVPGNINKYTYVTPRYIIGAVNWQDAYPEGSEAAWYAHHQQHEWELTLCGDTALRIFTHHPGSYGPEGKEHGYWTGDLGCCCGQFYCRKNTVLALYEIPEKEIPMIHTHIPLQKLTIQREGRYLWFQKEDEVYGMLWSYQGFGEGSREYRDVELQSMGRKHAVVCIAEEGSCYESLEVFKETLRQQEPVFNIDSMELRFGELFMSKSRRSFRGEQEALPYPNYGSPMIRSGLGSGVIETDKVVLDFEGWGTVTYK